MKIEVELQEVGDRTDELLSRVEQGQAIVITLRGKPVADLVPHKEETRRWLTPCEVGEIREIASGDPTWGAELAEMRAADKLDPIP
jgi:prevent-host-death family protein